jgi:hypothetical protein
MNRHLRCVFGALAMAPALAGELRVLNYGDPAVLGQQGNRDAGTGRFAVSDDGRHMVFVTASNNFSASDAGNRSYVHLKDTQTGETTRISRRGDGGEPDGSSFEAALRVTAAGSPMCRMRPTSWRRRRRDGISICSTGRAITQRIAPSPLPTPNPWPAHLYDPVLSSDGSRIALTTDAVLAASDGDPLDDAYLWSRADGTFTLLSVDAAGQALPASSTRVRSRCPPTDCAPVR